MRRRRKHLFHKNRRYERQHTKPDDHRRKNCCCHGTRTIAPLQKARKIGSGSNECTVDTEHIDPCNPDDRQTCNLADALDCFCIRLGLRIVIAHLRPFVYSEEYCNSRDDDNGAGRRHHCARTCLKVEHRRPEHRDEERKDAAPKLEESKGSPLMILCR